MKKFTKITLMIAAILVALGIICCGIAAIMGAGWTTIHQKALAGEFDFGNWHIGNGVYYAYDQGHGILDHFWDDDYDDWDDDYDDDDDWDDDDWDDEDDELMDDNRAVESFGSWILNLTDLKSEPAGTESCIIPAKTVRKSDTGHCSGSRGYFHGKRSVYGKKSKCVCWSGRTLCESDFSQRESRV